MVITPSLNKSFKFQSDWPYNNSQIYLLQPILDDLSNDSKRTMKTSKNGYIITSKVNYTSEKDFAKQKVYVDKNKNITKIEVLDSDDNVMMCLTIIDIDYKAEFDKNYFEASTYQSEEETTEEETTSKIEDVVYPMYVPTDTSLSSQDVVETDDGERVILTFGGESNFTVIQETCNKDKTTSYIYGDPYLILDTIGSITDSSVSWISNGIEYSVMSDSMDTEELISVAQSISVQAVGK